MTLFTGLKHHRFKHPDSTKPGTDHVEALREALIAIGYMDGTYKPHNNVRRADMAVYLVRALGESPIGTPTGIFPDVPPGPYYAGYVEKLHQLGITQGYADGTYRPWNPITRAEMAVFLIRALGLQPIPTPTGIFPDVPPGAWYAGYAEKLHAEGITQGYSDGTYRPDNTVNRGEMAAFIARAWNL